MIKELEERILEQLNNDEELRKRTASCLAVIIYDLQSNCSFTGLGTAMALSELSKDLIKDCCSSK